jgi:adenylate cyclase
MPGDLPSLPVAALQAHLLPLYEPLVEVLERLRPGLTAPLPPSRAELLAARGLERAMQYLRGVFRADPSLASQLAAAAEERPAAERHGLRALADVYGGSDSRYINFYGPAGTIETVPYDDALLQPSGEQFKGRTVFVGFAERRQPEQQDDFYSVFSQRSGLNLSGVEIGATAFANLLERTSIVPLPIPWHLLLVLLWGGALIGALAGLPPARAAAVAAAAGAAYAAAGYLSFTSAHVWLPLVVPLAVQLPLAVGLAAFLHYRDLKAQRARIHTALGYYVPADVVQRLAHETIDATADRRLVYGTCLFTDAERYTALSEALPPERLASLMSDYYEVMFAAVKRNGGLVSDTAGDAMVAVWATARPDPAARERACRAALEIQQAVAAFNRAHAERPLPTRLGLESGPLVLGNIGAGQRFEYRAIGDIVNTASRIQDLNRLLGTQVLASATTVTEWPAGAKRELGRFLLRGKSVPVDIFELLDRESAARPVEADSVFAAGLAAVQMGDWAEARRAFERSLALVPEDGPSAFYARLAADYARLPPSRWTGAVEITTR